MIRVKRLDDESVELIDIEELERRIASGELAPGQLVCVPPLTGERFVRAGDLELFRALFSTARQTFLRKFSLGRVPWLSLTLIVVLVATYFGWQRGHGETIALLTDQGAKNASLVVELGEWWRLLTAGLLHVSGWHLAMNAVFLFNLGGPTEAVYRRLDYALILVVSLLTSSLLSLAVNPAVTCGASGVVFGVLGAAAVFGIRHREILPERYRRYFIGSVIPYSIFALYLGVAVPGIDNWAHLGGLVGGASMAVALPSRLLEPRDPLAAAKVAGLGIAALALALLSSLPAGPGELVRRRYFTRQGLELAVPARWRATAERRDTGFESFTFANRAGVGVTLQMEHRDEDVSLDQLARDFLASGLPEELDQDAASLVIHAHELTAVAGVQATRVRTRVQAAGIAIDGEHLLFARGRSAFVVSLAAPAALVPAYRSTFDAIVASATLVPEQQP